jgi:hypothetical protein
MTASAEGATGGGGDGLVLLIARGSKHLIEIHHCGIELILRIEIEQAAPRQFNAHASGIVIGIKEDVDS